MKLLNIEVTSRGAVFDTRYDIFRKNGAEVYHLTMAYQASVYPHFSGVRHLPTQTLDSVVEVARQWHQKIGFDAVITTDEASVLSAAAIADDISLPGVSLNAAAKSRNKYYMRQAHQANGAPCPDFKLCYSLESALEAAETIGYPVVIKPTLGGNAEHVYLVRDEQTLKERFPVASAANQAYSYCVHEASSDALGPNAMLVEGYLSGSEHCIEAWVFEGKAHIGSIADRLSVELDIFDNDLYRTPSALTDSQVDLLAAALQAGVEAQSITHGVVHAEFRFHQGQPYIVEIAARVGGGSLSKMAQLSYGYCPITTAYLIATNQPPTHATLSPTGKVAVGLTMLCRQGRIKDIRVPELVTNHPQVFNLAILAKPGDVHRRPPEGNDMFGYIGVTGQSQQEAIELAGRLFEEIQIDFYTNSALEDVHFVKENS
ncbi:ATP-grasp domain-containing protein [Vibrio aestuarianus]|uniref:ATP-grasp domain-containing protein n=1 Tax=Vibrio aestuarianus TaxID=28171 RepID=A0A9X4EXE0_9VIBR|nr:ATP-grasp domain-containing protein [Vibrio aestuarianus]MDE1244036.1 ATP-grasp domain-containing protein [Vibrio aestuarianus]